jgi:localization factor PodJL
MAGTLSAPPSSEPPNLEPDAFDEAAGAEANFRSKSAGLSFLEQARRAAKRAAEADAERPAQKRAAFPYKEEGKGGRKLGRLAIIGVAALAVVAGIFALMFTFPGPGDNDGINRPNGVDSMNELLNGGPPAPQPLEPMPSAGSPAEFAPPTAADGAPTAPSVAVEPNGLGVPTSEPAAPAFTAGQPPLPGEPPADARIATLEAGAVKGDATAQFELGLRYAEGRGVAKDDAKAASLVTKAAQQGLTVAEYRLGAIYERGVGLTKDLAQAKMWYERAAKGGNRKAMHNLAVLYADGAGVGQNLQEAARWFREGAAYGLPDSQYNLGILLERGMGVEKNVGEAAKWFAIAAAQGDAGAAERLEKLKPTMASSDVAIALEAARKFKPKPMNPTANEAPTFAG